MGLPMRERRESALKKSSLTSEFYILILLHPCVVSIEKIEKQINTVELNHCYQK